MCPFRSKVYSILSLFELSLDRGSTNLIIVALIESKMLKRISNYLINKISETKGEKMALRKRSYIYAFIVNGHVRPICPNWGINAATLFADQFIQAFNLNVIVFFFSLYIYKHNARSICFVCLHWLLTKFLAK